MLLLSLARITQVNQLIMMMYDERVVISAMEQDKQHHSMIWFPVKSLFCSQAQDTSQHSTTKQLLASKTAVMNFVTINAACMLEWHSKWHTEESILNWAIQPLMSNTIACYYGNYKIPELTEAVKACREWDSKSITPKALTERTLFFLKSYLPKLVPNSHLWDINLTWQSWAELPSVYKRKWNHILSQIKFNWVDWSLGEMTFQLVLGV